MRIRLSPIGLMLCLCALSVDAAGQQEPSHRRAHQMVSSAHPLATQAGIRIQDTGGNAFDAAVAVAATLNVVEPMMSGMGGYGTILIYDARADEIRFLDSSGKIPQALDSDVFRAPTENFMGNRRGPKSVSTPGNVNAWEALSKEYGQLPWESLFDGPIQLAGEGFPVSRRLAWSIRAAYAQFPDHAKLIYGDGKRPLQADDRLIQKDLANSFRSVARHGSRVFYEGELARKIHDEMKARGSFLSIEDLKNDRAEWWEPIHIDYRGFEVFTASPPATAFPSLIRLGLMSQLDPSTLRHNSADYLHTYAEVTKHAYQCRLQFAGDPEIQPPPLDRLLSPDYWRDQFGQIDSQRARPFEPPKLESTSNDNTTHFVVADRWGNIVSATQTLGNLFGSRIMPPDTGIWFNNSLAYCTFVPKGNPMDAKPGQRKLSGDCPTIILKGGKPWAALGTPGGHSIGQTVPQMVMNLIDFDMDIQKAIEAPRISFVEPDLIVAEQGIDSNVIAELNHRGHNVRTGSLGNAHGLRVYYASTGGPPSYEGAADPRGEGKAAGKQD